MRVDLRSMGTMIAVAILSLSLVSCGPATEPRAPTSATEPAVTTTVAPATTSTIAAPATSAAPVTTQPEASERQFGFVAPFVITIPASWARNEVSTQQVLYIEAGINPIVFAVSERESVDEWMEYLTGNEGLVATDPVPVTIDGASGFSTDIRLSEAATDAGCQAQGRCVTILSGFTGWTIYDDLPNRVWVVDVEGRPVFIAAEASEGSFDAFSSVVEEALATLVWTSSS